MALKPAMMLSMESLNFTTRRASRYTNANTSAMMEPHGSATNASVSPKARMTF